MVGIIETASLLRDGRVMRVERFLKQPVKNVWAAITEPHKLVRWLANADFELKEGAPLTLKFDNTGTVVHGKITQVDPPDLLEFTWDDQTVGPLEKRTAEALAANGTCGQPLALTRVRIELQPQSSGTLLTLTHTIPAEKVAPAGARLHNDKNFVDQAVVLASWQNHLDGLAHSFDEGFRVLARDTWNWGRWQTLRDKYSGMLN